MPGIGDTQGDDWNDMAKLYKELSYGTSALPTAAMLERTNALLPFSEATGILDNGSGPGPVMQRLLEGYKVPNDCTLTCSDFSQGMINQALQTKEESIKADRNSPWTRMNAIVQDATNLDNIADGSQSHVTAGFVYFMTSDPMKALTETRRVLKDGGVFACTSWHSSEWMDLMYLLPTIRPDKVMPQMRPEWIDATKLKGELEKAGFKDVDVREVKTQMAFEKRKPLIEFMSVKMPHLKPLVEDMPEEEIQKYQDLMDEEMKKMDPNEPGKLKGITLVAVGKK
ncbi:uncharacterized protein LTR77_001422 [Saxophila tyrrhenica]|uniref:Methyltransferase type 11 domain-containing protein n=1 Tax=Saxophila tyrrhenica TaxID=1690608 RepID=A0AAV9PPV9_9PEZI|nr:hypothetical protein LTR77_001422 [Saxophila tyrrhenica]